MCMGEHFDGMRKHVDLCNITAMIDDAEKTQNVN